MKLHTLSEAIFRIRDKKIRFRNVFMLKYTESIHYYTSEKKENQNQKLN